MEWSIDWKIVLPIISLVCLLVWIWLIRKAKHQKRVCTHPVIWKVISVDVDDDDNWRSYSPVYSFEVNWKEYSWKIWISTSSRKKIKVWDTRELLYNPENPKEFIDTKSNNNKWAWIVFIVMWIVFAAMAVLSLNG